MLSSEVKHFVCNWVSLPGLHRGAVQAWYLLSQGRTWLGRRNWLDFGWKWMDIAERSTGILIRKFFFAHIKILVIVWAKVSIWRLEMMCTPSAHPPEEPSSCALLPERVVLLRALRDRWEARRWGCAGPRTLDLGQAMQWCLFCLKEKLWSFCIWRKNVGNKRICRGCQTWGKDRIRKAVSVLPHPRLWASSLEVLR